jgi:hypothetical protein
MPYRILKYASYMNVSDAIPFIKSEFYFHLNRMKVHGVTFQFRITNGKPSIAVRSYDEETEALAKDLNGRKYKNTEDLIKDALLKLKKCIYVVLEADDSSMKFIQFRSEANTYWLDIPLTPLTLNRDYSGDIIALLRKQGFTKSKTKNYAFKYKTYTICPLGEELTSINAEFGNDLKLTVETSSYIFKKIFQTKKVPRVIFG